MSKDSNFQETTQSWLNQSLRYEYSYHFTWMGIPIIQYPQDMVAMQEIIWDVKPDLIIETGVARGGSIIFYASMLEMMGLEGDVIGIDIDIRPHNRDAIETHPLFKRIILLEGSSTDAAMIEQIRDIAKDRKRILVALDSNHTHEHVLEELRLYAPFVTEGSYLVAFDTVIHDMPPELSENRPWSPERNPKTAVFEFLKSTDDFEIDSSITKKTVFTVAPDGYLRRIKK
ncbi:MAG: cephalosporin hydroxylase family protein [Anaerolineae bacterium]|nr:cephalosporin hydroxylase family protein [Anaerolineae bacterium]